MPKTGQQKLFEVSGDFDNDGRQEKLVGYMIEGIPTVAIYQGQGRSMKLVDTYTGVGYGMDGVKVVGNEESKNLFVGFRLGNELSRLDILRYHGGVIRKLFPEQPLIYSKWELIDFRKDGNPAIVLWTHDTMEAYSTSIYEIRGKQLVKTKQFDKVYYPKVSEYYKGLLRKTRNNPVYLYYLAEAQLKTENYLEASITIEKAMQSEKPYPSLEDLKRMQSVIIKKLLKM